MRRSPLLIGALIAVLGATGQAHAQLEAQLSELNGQALEAYQALDLETARAKLEEALGMAQQAGYMGPEVAQSFMNLGVVFVAGMGDRDQGLSAFVNAVCFLPDVQLDPLLSTPDVQAVFAQAQADARAGACGPGPGPQGPGGPPPQLMPTPSTAPPSVMGGGPQVMDQECPPGVVCNVEGVERARTDFARFFVNVQFVAGFSWVSSGMEADRKPTPEQILSRTEGFDFVYDQAGNPVLDMNGDPMVVTVPVNDSDRNGLPDPLPFDRNMNGMLDDYPEVNTFADRNMDGVLDGRDLDVNMDGLPDGTDDVNFDGVADGTDFNKDGIVDNRFLFDDKSAWVPDGDSYDDFQNVAFDIPRGRTPIPGNCSADGQASGPIDPFVTGPNGEMFTTMEPTKYCVRVETPGLVSNVALRINPGYFITDTFALSLPFRFQFDAGQGSFSHVLLGLRGEVLFSKMTAATGFPISVFFGATYGQIQARPKPKDPARPAPWAISGPLGLHAGLNVRWRIIRNFGLILAPEFDVMLPHLLFHGDLSLGVEAAF